MARMTVKQLDDLITRIAEPSYGERNSTRDMARKELRTALIEAYLEADESVVLREQLDIQTRKVLIVEQEKRELLAQAAIGDLVVLYAPLQITTRAEFAEQGDPLPKGVALIFSDDPEPPKAPKATK